MNLHELAIGCWIYKTISGDDSTVTRLRAATGGQVDPHNPHHQKVLFKWLNEWGCRQFNKTHHTVAARSLETWADRWLAALPPDNAVLENITQEQIDVAGAAYDDLRRRQAGERALTNGSASSVTYGPVGAAKTLFALRPNTCAPWDRYTLDKLGFDQLDASYSKYLRRVLSDLREVSNQAGIQIAELPALVGRPKATPPKLIDEYYWVMITRGFSPPPLETMKEWIAWAELK